MDNQPTRQATSVVPMAVVRVFSSWGVLYYIKLVSLLAVGAISYGLLHDVLRVWFDEEPLAAVGGESYVYIHAGLIVAAVLFFCLQRLTTKAERTNRELLVDPSRKRACQYTFWISLSLAIVGAVWLLGSMLEMIYGVGFEEFGRNFWRTATSGIIGTLIASSIVLYSFYEERRVQS
jgi:hypothetical protein